MTDNRDPEREPSQRAKHWDAWPDFSEVFPGELKIALSQIAHDLGIGYKLLAQWGRERRYRYHRDAHYPHQVWVPLAEIPKIAAIPRGRGRPGLKGDARREATEKRAQALFDEALLRDIRENPDK